MPWLGSETPYKGPVHSILVVQVVYFKPSPLRIVVKGKGKRVLHGLAFSRSVHQKQSQSFSHSVAMSGL